MYKYKLNEAQRFIMKTILTAMENRPRGFQFVSFPVDAEFEQVFSLTVPLYLLGCTHIKVYDGKDGSYTFQCVFNNTNNHRRRIGLPMIRRKRGH